MANFQLTVCGDAHTANNTEIGESRDRCCRPLAEATTYPTNANQNYNSVNKNYITLSLSVECENISERRARITLYETIEIPKAQE